MDLKVGLSLPLLSLREHLQACALSQGVTEDVAIWIPQPGAPQPLFQKVLRGRPIDLERVRVSGRGRGALEAYLGEAQAHWETRLAAHSRRLVVAQAMHGLSNALTPLLCSETADSMTVEEIARVSWRSDTLRHLSRGAETPTPCAAGPFLQNVKRALEHAGVLLSVDCPEDLARRPLAAEHMLLRSRILQLVLAADKARSPGESLSLSLREEGDALSLELLVPPDALFSRHSRGDVTRSPSQTSVRLTLPTPWLVWLGAPPPSDLGLRELGVGLVVVPELDDWDRALSAKPAGLADRPLGVALGGSRKNHARLKRELLTRDLGLGRACYSAASWPSCRIPEVVDVAAWCHAAAGQAP